MKAMLTGGFWDPGKIVLMYALHTHVFEWRQSTSMLNPTGLQGTFGNVDSAYDIGEGLRERRRWLKDGLDSFAECYGGPGTSAGVWKHPPISFPHSEPFSPTFRREENS